MLKEKFENAKQFVKDHKKEIIIGSICIAGAIIGRKLIKNFDGTLEKVTTQLPKKDSKKEKDLYTTAYNKAVDYANEVLIPQINEKYQEYDFSAESLKDSKIADIYQQYLNEYDNLFEEAINNEMSKLTD